MEGVLSFASQHPLVAILIAAVAVVVLFHFVKAYFWRIVTILILTVIGYALYINGYFSKDRLDRLKSVDVKVIERKAEEGLREGISGAKNITSDKAEKEADVLRDDVKKEIMPVLSSTPEKGTAAARAAAADAAKKRHTPASGDNDAKK
ncbi:MAG TPA: hypothetical protein VF857_04265 [Spirochaetota bacterium]